MVNIFGQYTIRAGDEHGQHTVAELDLRFQKNDGSPFCYNNEQCQNHCSLRVKFAKPGGAMAPFGPHKAPPMSTQSMLNKA